jgi:demethylmenaquinone methyltransferase/2-methoxy-6-polyprenyl-1,4-benzoquinol methylase
MKPFLLFYLRRIVPLLGRIISGAGDAYAYLAESTESFKTPEELAAVMEKAGLVDVRFRTFMFGTMAVHAGKRPR